MFGKNIMPEQLITCFHCNEWTNLTTEHATKKYPWIMCQHCGGLLGLNTENKIAKIYQESFTNLKWIPHVIDGKWMMKRSNGSQIETRNPTLWEKIKILFWYAQRRC